MYCLWYMLYLANSQKIPCQRANINGMCCVIDTRWWEYRASTTMYAPFTSLALVNKNKAILLLCHIFSLIFLNTFCLKVAMLQIWSFFKFLYKFEVIILYKSGRNWRNIWKMKTKHQWFLSSTQNHHEVLCLNRGNGYEFTISSTFKL